MRDVDIFRLAGGEKDRDYSGLLLEKDVGAIGPDIGDLSDSRSLDNSALTPRALGFLRSFSEVVEGDLILLANGQDPITVGRVLRDPATNTAYRYTPEIGLFGHWDLSNVIRVKWADPEDEEVKPILRDAFHSLGGGSVKPRIRQRGRFCRIGQEHIRGWVRDLDVSLEAIGYWDRPLARAEFDDQVLKGGISQLESFRSLPEGVRTATQKIVDLAARLWDINEDRGWDPILSEHENVALLVVPFLMALGWQPETLALEWHRVDVAIFESTERDVPLMMVEAKRPLKGLDWARGQAGTYAENARVDCPIITTDGFYWAIFSNPRTRRPDGELFLPKIYESAGKFFDNLKMYLPSTS